MVNVCLKYIMNSKSPLHAYFNELRQMPELTPEAIPALAQQARAGDISARDRLVCAHMRFAAGLARKYTGFGLPLGDLISEANIGLIRAAELFDPAYGTHFANYAALWIKQRIHRAICKQAQAVRIPHWRMQRLRKLSRMNDEATAENGQPLTDEAFAEYLGIHPDQLHSMRQDRIEVHSLSGADDDTTESALDRVPDLVDENLPSPNARLEVAELREDAIAAMDVLDDRELEIVAAKHGLHPAGERSFRETARRTGKSHEWVRRVGRDALVKVRHAFEQLADAPEALRQARARRVLARLKAISFGGIVPMNASS